ncbi:MAG: hypothetical protein ACR2M3_14465 [Thermomicrobiales bacterium]
MTALFERAGFTDVRVLHRERNARTGNEAAVVLTIEARKPQG